MAKVSLRDELHAQVSSSVKAGARLHLGGEPLELRGKSYYPPTLLSGVKPGMPVFDEETFGPVAAVTRVKHEEQAVEFADIGPFGLGAAVFSTDINRARRMAEQLQAGTVAINAQVVSDPRFPFGGVKQSGWGRELGEHGIREFVNVKTVRV
jgi:succinate-semialdehyde dehydrogenase/glutarate-semialdehyde dehydrogenase